MATSCMGTRKDTECRTKRGYTVEFISLYNMNKLLRDIVIMFTRDLIYVSDVNVCVWVGALSFH